MVTAQTKRLNCRIQRLHKLVFQIVTETGTVAMVRSVGQVMRRQGQMKRRKTAVSPRLKVFQSLKGFRAHCRGKILFKVWEPV
jgi:hypothetical protein